MLPAITVIVDGGWSKRSHRHSYNAKSGVGIIIRHWTKKILHMSVQNKYCASCAAGSPRDKHHSLQYNCGLVAVNGEHWRHSFCVKFLRTALFSGPSDQVFSVVRCLGQSQGVKTLSGELPFEIYGSKKANARPG